MIDVVDIAPNSVMCLFVDILIDEVLHKSKYLQLSHWPHNEELLRRIKNIQRYIPTSVAIHIVEALALPRIDYCNSVLLGLPSRTCQQLQSVWTFLFAWSSVVSEHNHVTPFLRDKLRWLKTSECIFKQCLLTYRVLNDPFCPNYILLVTRCTLNDWCSKLCSSSQAQQLVPPPAKTAKFDEQLASWGTSILWNSLELHPIRWNSLLVNVTSCKSIIKFQNNLKTHTFNNLYMWHLSKHPWLWPLFFHSHYTNFLANNYNHFETSDQINQP